MNGLFRIIALVMLCVKSSNSLCSEKFHCASCTEEVACGWSMEELPECLPTEKIKGKLSINIPSECPKFSVVQSYAVREIPYTHKVKISNDLRGFSSLIKYAEIDCYFGRYGIWSKRGYVNDDVIVCGVINFNEYDNKTPYALVKVFFKFRNNERIRIRIPNSYNLTIYDVNIRSVEPLYAPWSGNTTVTIAITNHWAIVAENYSEIVVTTAGRSCGNIKTLDNETITCTVSPANDTGGTADGKVKVVYLPPLTVYPPNRYTVTSQQKFNLVEPQITGISPVCGPVNKRTVLNIRGEYLNVGNTFNVYIVSENSTVRCETVSQSRNKAKCRIMPSVGGMAFRGRVTVVIDGSVAKYEGSDTEPQFSYVTGPAVDEEQMFAGITAGSTLVPVRGLHFSCLADYSASLFVVHNATRHYGRGCRVTNDTFMVCESPTLDNKSPSVAGTYLEVGFRSRFVNDESDLYITPRMGYFVHPNPAFADFEINNDCTVKINGLVTANDYRPLSYRIEDVTVRLQNQGDAADVELLCLVTLVTPNQIVCKVDCRNELLDVLQTVKVTVGAFSCYVHRKPVQYSSVISTISCVIIAIFLFALFLVRVLPPTVTMPYKHYRAKVRRSSRAGHDGKERSIRSES